MTPANQQLSHVYWIGGSPCCGKTSTAQSLAERFGFTYYNCDEAFFRHARIIQPESQPAFSRVMGYSSEELWMRPVEVQLADEITIYREEFPLILDDLLALPTDPPILAEGAALMPELILPYLNASARCIWMVPTPEFQVTHYLRRDWAKELVKDCSDPNQAFRNWMNRDIGFAIEVRRRAEELNLPVLVVDGSRSIEDNISYVEKWLGLA